MTEITKKSSVTKDRTTSPFWGDWACKFNTGETMKNPSHSWEKCQTPSLCGFPSFAFAILQSFPNWSLRFASCCVEKWTRQSSKKKWLCGFTSFNVLPPHWIPPCLDFAGLAQSAGTCKDTKQKPKRAFHHNIYIYMIHTQNHNSLGLTGSKKERPSSGALSTSTFPYLSCKKSLVAQWRTPLQQCWWNQSPGKPFFTCSHQSSCWRKGKKVGESNLFRSCTGHLSRTLHWRVQPTTNQCWIS